MNNAKPVARRVLCIANTAWYLWNFRLALMRMFQEQGFEVIAVAPADPYAERMAAEGITFVPLEISRRGTNPAAELVTVLRLQKILKEHRPDLILSFTHKANIYASLAARSKSIPVINTVSGLGYAFIRKGVLQTVVKGLCRVAFSGSARVFFENRDDMKFFLEEKVLAPQRAGYVPGAGVDTVKFSPAGSAEAAPLSFLVVARMLWDKGIGEFVDAARQVRRRHPDALFQLLGPIDEGNPAAIAKGQIDEWVAEGVVQYLGCTDRVADFVAGAGCVVLPSYREGVPVSLLEACSMAKPVITTDAPGCRDVVEHGRTGFLCPVKDAGALAARMEEFIALSAQERSEMGALGRERILKEFSERIVLGRYAEAAAALGLVPPAATAPAVVALKGVRRRTGALEAAPAQGESVTVESAA